MQAWNIEGGSIWRGDSWEDTTLTLSDGKIADRPSLPARRVDAQDCLVLPGMIDLHGDSFEHQWKPRASAVMPFEVALPENDRQLVANGITTAFYSVTIGFESELRSLERATALIEALDTQRHDLSVESPIHLRFETRLGEHVPTVERLIEQGAIRILSFNDHVADQIAQLQTPGNRENHFAQSGQSPAEFTNMLDDLAALDDTTIDERILRLSKQAHNCSVRTMIHDPCGAAEIDRFADLGCEIAEFPMDEAAARRATARAMPVVMGCPNVMRGGSHKGAVGAQDLIGKGLSELLVSDYYYPSMLAAVMRLADGDTMRFGQAWNYVSQNPAKAVGLRDRGQVRAGKRGDIVILRPGSIPKIEAVFVAGQLCYATNVSAI